MPRDPDAANRTDQEVRDTLARLLFELDFYLRIAAGRDMTLTPDLVEREAGPLVTRTYTSVVVPELE